MCSFLCFKIVDKNFFTNITDSNNKLYIENKILKKQIIKLNNNTEQLNKDLFTIKKNILDYEYRIKKDDNYIMYLLDIIYKIRDKISKNITQDEINEINEYIDNFLDY